jgi:prefoldin subunit 5
MTVRTLIVIGSAVAAFYTGFGSISVAAPDVATKLDTFLRNNVLGWSAESCAANALGCLETKYDTLSASEVSAGVSITQLRSALEQTKALAEEKGLELQKNQAFLEKGKVIIKSSELTNSNEIEFAGKTYPDLATFRSQIQLIFEEKSVLEATYKSVLDLKNKLQADLDALIIHRGRISLAKQMIPAQIELVRANQTLSNFQVNLAMIDGVIKGSQGSIADSESLIRSTKELMATGDIPAAITTPASKSPNQALEEFLQH